MSIPGISEAGWSSIPDSIPRMRLGEGKDARRRAEPAQNEPVLACAVRPAAWGAKGFPADPRSEGSGEGKNASPGERNPNPSTCSGRALVGTSRSQPEPASGRAEGLADPSSAWRDLGGGGGAQASVSPVPGMIWVQLEGRVARACDGEACESQQPRWELKMACVLTGGARLAGRRGRRRRWWRRRRGGGFGFIVIPLLCRRLAPGGRRQSARGRPPSDEAKAQKTLREMHNFPSVGFPRRQTGSGGRAGVGGGEVLSRVAAPARRTGYGRWRSLFSAKDAAPSVFAALSSGAARSLLHPVFVHVHT